MCVHIYINIYLCISQVAESVGRTFTAIRWWRVKHFISLSRQLSDLL